MVIIRLRYAMFAQFIMYEHYYMAYLLVFSRRGVYPKKTGTLRSRRCRWKDLQKISGFQKGYPYPQVLQEFARVKIVFIFFPNFESLALIGML